LTDKYSGYDSSIAFILRGFMTWAEGYYVTTDTSRAVINNARYQIKQLADQAQREVDEARAAK
jgi:hypothetical protein